MHGVSETFFPLSSSSLSQTHLPLSLPYLLNIIKSSTPTCRSHHPIVSFKRPLPHNNTLWNCYSTFKHNNRSLLLRARASSRESPYDVLGVSPSATPNEIKTAYRKLALKYHPDVNKEANAQERFMRIKHAYNTLMNPESQRKYDFRNRTSDYSSSSRNRSKNMQEEEEFYGFEDFFRDLQTEFQNWEASATSQGKPKSLWEELADIGEEFVEFLEKELNITDSDADMENKDNQTMKENTIEDSNLGAGKNDQKQANSKSSIEENIDEIEAALARLKKELGL